MQPNQTVELIITDIGMDGEGIAKYEGVTFFVPYALKGERVKAKITHIKKGKNIGYAVLKEILEPSLDRVTPPCNRFTRCGGCTMMHLDYGKQVECKRENLKRILRKNTGIDYEVDEVVTSSPFHYRNKAQIPFGIVNGKVALGFYAVNTHKIVSSTKCFLHGEWIETLIKIVLDFANAENLSVYDEVTKKGLLRHLVARYIGGKMVVTLVINGDSVKNVDKLYNSLKESFNNLSLYLCPNKKDTNVIMGERLIPVSENKDFIEIMGVEVDVNPFSFFQVNDEIRTKLYEKVIEEVAPSDGTVVIDAYAGVGLMGAIMAKRGANVFNIEIVKEAVEDGFKLYKRNGLLDKVYNILGDATIELKKLVTDTENEDLLPQTKAFSELVASGKKVKIILDPPRKGISLEVANTLNALTKNLPFDLIYVSCNPATLSRDIKNLSLFEVKQITPFDMFPHTSHVETLVSLYRK